MVYLKHVCLLVAFFNFTGSCFAQAPLPDSVSYKVVPAGAEYKKPKVYQWLWGKNRRKEWTTPVRVPVIYLDKLYGGLYPYQQGGGNETKSLRLRSIKGNEYTMRSINKSRNDVVSPEFKGTVVEDIIQDGVSMSYPYASFALPIMQEQAGIPHTNPILIYIPPQAALDTFNNKFQNDLYLLEQRPDGDWSTSVNLGRFKKFISTIKVIEKLLEDNTSSADQRAFVKVRLFDMLLSDWDRHEDNWRWGVSDTAGSVFYVPVPRDRDQAFYSKDGILISPIMAITDLSFMQNFSYRVKNISMLNIEQRNMDRFFTNKMNLKDWVTQAKELQQSLTDSVIFQSVKGMPDEIFKLSGAELGAKLISRRNQLQDFAAKYYLFLAKEVEITGSEKREYFEVKRLEAGQTMVNVFRMNKRSVKNDTPFYSRIFNAAETKEIRLYGIDGNDIYSIIDKSPRIKIRIIGGTGNDSVAAFTKKRVHIYDDNANRFKNISAKFHLSNDSAIHAFNYAGYNYNTKHIVPYILFNNRDRWYFGLNYTNLRHRWRKEPYASNRTIGLNYYGATRSIIASIATLYPNLIGKWDFTVFGGYNALKWTNFFGTGNNTKLSSQDRTYHRIRSIEGIAKAGISRQIGKSSVGISALFQGVKILNDTSRYVAKVLQNQKEFKPNYYTGIQLSYHYLKVNDSIVPTRGYSLLANANYYRNITQSDFFQNYIVKIQAYWPLNHKFSLAVRSGIETIIGNSSLVNNAQLYQHAVIGGPVHIRGYRAERFWGKSSFYNQNEIRYITNFTTRLMNGKAGLLAFFDNGRVWMPDEKSGILHTSFGGGILIAPFNKISAFITYGITNESRLMQLVVSTLF